MRLPFSRRDRVEPVASIPPPDPGGATATMEFGDAPAYPLAVRTHFPPVINMPSEPVGLALSQAAQVTEARRNVVVFQEPIGRASWDTNLGYLNGFLKVPQEQGYAVYAALREAVPILDAMIAHLVAFIGLPQVCGDDETVQELNTFLGQLSVNRTQTGFSNWVNNWFQTMLHYGRAHGEVILNRDQSDVYAISPLSPRTIRIVPGEDGYSVRYMQQQRGGNMVELPQELLLTAIHDNRGDAPDGTSVLWGLPLVGEIVAKMFTDVGLMWDREGVARYHVNWEPPDDWNDPNGDAANEIMNDLAKRFSSGLKEGTQGTIKDYFTAGKVTVKMIGVDGKRMVLEENLRPLIEMIVARSGLPPWVFGLSWASTERMSAVQAGGMMARIDSARAEVGSPLLYFLRLRQLIGGRDPDVHLEWPRVTLMDRSESATAQLKEEQADAQCWTNNVRAWQMGVLTRYEFVRRVRPEFDELSDQEIDEKLPDLPQTPPATAVTNVGDNSGGSQVGQGGGQPILTGNGLYGMMMRARR